MRRMRFPSTTLAVFGLLALLPSAPVRAQSAVPSAKQESTMTHAAGTFEVKITPQAPEAGALAQGPGRMTLDKQFKGDLEGVSVGQMLAIGTEVKESAGYVAIERVTGVLHGHKGSFALQHTGTMNRGVPSLSVTVVPDSGTGDLVGLSGRMTIDVSGGKHAYTFDYTLPKP